MDIHRYGNMIEAGVWLVAALLVFGRCFREPPTAKRALSLLAPTLVLFGISDLVEARTGAWWRPWWLFTWKAACVVAMAILFAKYFRAVKR